MCAHTVACVVCHCTHLDRCVLSLPAGCETLADRVAAKVGLKDLLHAMEVTYGTRNIFLLDTTLESCRDQDLMGALHSSAQDGEWPAGGRAQDAPGSPSAVPQPAVSPCTWWLCRSCLAATYTQPCVQA